MEGRRRHINNNLPPLEKEAITLERLSRKTLGEVVGLLKLGLHLVDDKFSGMGPERVPSDKEVASPIGKSMSGGEVEGTLVVLEHSSSNCRLKSLSLFE